ncbi:MAG: threonine/serine dehydratase [Bacteroidia bacterium]|nr:threonine/serine dehydratase [Bacteroidia bacterium]
MYNSQNSPLAPSLDEMEQASKAIAPYITNTPVSQWLGPAKDELLGPKTEVFVKLELLQRGGSFKARGALINMLTLTDEQKRRGVTAVSAGNHAIAVSFAAKMLGTPAKVVMPRSANSFRINRCEELGTELVLVDNVGQAFEEAERIQNEEGRIFIHPFEGRGVATGTGTLGLEFARQVAGLDAVIIPIGGGGLAAGMATAIKYLQPSCNIYGVEPTGADSMSRSLDSGTPEKIDAVRTIADSLGAPFAMPYSFALVQKALERIVLVEDHQLRSSMKLMFEELKLAVEPAGAASMAALLGPLKEELQGKRIGLIACGSNIDLASFYRLLRL